MTPATAHLCDQFINSRGLVRLTKAMYEKWGIIMGLKEYDRICFDHFDPSEIVVKDYMPRLKKGAVPVLQPRERT